MIYRDEQPNPKQESEMWRNLNVEWKFDSDFGNTARERKPTLYTEKNQGW